MYIYKNLLFIRKEKGYSQQYVASSLGLTQQQYSLYEKGLRDIPTRILKSLAKFYGVTMDYLAE